MHLSEEAKYAMRLAGLAAEVSTISNHLVNTAHLAYLPMDRILEGTISLPAGDYGTRPVLAHPLDTIAAVKTFMLVAGQQVNERPAQPGLHILKLRLSLELEELYEKAQAFGLEGTFQDMLLDKSTAYLGREGENPTGKDTFIYDAVEVLDAAVDQRYVQDGTVLACGLQDAFPEAFADVQASNMSKFPATAEELAATVEKYTREGVSIKVDFVNDGFPVIVTRAADGKVLKNAAYTPANLAPILAKHNGS